MKDKARVQDNVARHWRHEIAVAIAAATASNYTFVRDIRLVGLYLIVFVRDSLIDHTRAVCTSSAAVGIGGKIVR